MTAPIGGPAPRALTTQEEQALRRAAKGLEGMFLRQMLQAMRETVPDGGLDGGQGGQLFTAMLDDRLADLAAEQSMRGPGEALYRQLAERLRATPEGKSP